MTIYSWTLLVLLVLVYLNVPGRFFFFVSGCLLIILGSLPWITLDMVTR
jgi:hypothetical protein